MNNNWMRNKKKDIEVLIFMKSFKIFVKFGRVFGCKSVS